MAFDRINCSRYAFASSVIGTQRMHITPPSVTCKQVHAEIRRGKAGSLHIIHSAFSTQSSETSGLLSRMKALVTVEINSDNQSLSTAPSVTVELFTSLC